MTEEVGEKKTTSQHVKLQLLPWTKERKHLTRTTSQLKMNAWVCWYNSYQVLMVGHVREVIIQLDDNLHRGSQTED